MTTNDKKSRTMGLRITDKIMAEVRIKMGEKSAEYAFISTLKEAAVPYSVLGSLLNKDPNHLRDLITLRKRYADEREHEIICVKLKKVLDQALDDGLLPCSDLSVIDPILRLTLRVMALSK